MRKYLAFIASQLKLETAYVSWYWAGMISLLIELVIIYSIWHAVYETRQQVADFSLQAMLTYAVMAWLLGRYVYGVGADLAMQVRDGNIAVELLRPYDLLLKTVCIDLGRVLSNLFREMVPVLVVAFLFLQISLPHSFEAALLFLLSALIGILLGAQLDLILGVLSFYLVYIWGLRVLREAVYIFFTGTLIPLAMFPEWLLNVSQWLPFQSMVYVPVSIYIGQLQGTAAWQAIAVQLLWLLVVVVLIRICWSLALRKVTIFGG